MSKMDESWSVPVSDRDWGSLPKVLYHATRYEKLPRIDEEGLGANRDAQEKMDGAGYGGVFAEDGFFLAQSDDETVAYFEWEDGYSPDEWVVLCVPKSLLEKERLYYDTNQPAGQERADRAENGTTDGPLYHGLAFYYRGVIDDPSGKLELIEM